MPQGSSLEFTVMSDETRPHRDDSETPQQTASREKAEAVEGHIVGVEEAASTGHLSRRQAERVIDAGQKSVRSHDMARGIQRKE